jgi:hypothetical protein
LELDDKAQTLNYEHYYPYGGTALIAGVMIKVLVSKADEPTIYRFRDKNANHYVTDEPTTYTFRDKHSYHYATDEPTIYRFRDKNANYYATNVLVSKVVDRGFIGDIMVSVLV